MNNPAKVIIAVIAVVIVIYLALVFDIPQKEMLVNDFDTCVAAGNPVMESYPRQCRDEDGNLYVEEVATVEPTDMIRVSAPASNATVESPVAVTGDARGSWYFEASFAAEVFDANGKSLGMSPIQAQGEWMTTDFVPFKGSITFSKPTTATGYIRFHKDNPSGDPIRDAHVDIPVKFKNVTSGTGTGTTTTAKACKPTGCSGQICSDEDVVSTCEFRSEYACYRTAECKRQSNGSCGWTQSSALLACLANPPQE
jgi:hypothetical protein